MKCICFKKLYQDFVRLCFFSGVHFEINFTTEMLHKVVTEFRREESQYNNRFSTLFLFINFK